MHFNRKLGTFKVRRMSGLSILTRDHQALFSFLGRQGETKRKCRCNKIKVILNGCFGKCQTIIKVGSSVRRRFYIIIRHFFVSYITKGI